MGGILSAHFTQFRFNIFLAPNLISNFLPEEPFVAFSDLVEGIPNCFPSDAEMTCQFFLGLLFLPIAREIVGRQDRDFT